ncbi:hypothetical protein V2I01_00285 [Micromonospora sp. BRA006-A]|nr:hypothetical protein [Micromonospora sp. BRA006-A]
MRDRLVPLTERYFADHFAGTSWCSGYADARRSPQRWTGSPRCGVELPDRLFEVTLEPSLRLR